MADACSGAGFVIEETRQVPRSVHNPNNLHLGAVQAIEHDIIVKDQHAGPGRNFRAGCAKIGVGRQILAPANEAINQPIGSGRIVQRHAQPDIIEVGSGTRRARYPGHESNVRKSGDRFSAITLRKINNLERRPESI